VIILRVLKLKPPPPVRWSVHTIDTYNSELLNAHRWLHLIHRRIHLAQGCCRHLHCLVFSTFSVCMFSTVSVCVSTPEGCRRCQQCPAGARAGDAQVQIWHTCFYSEEQCENVLRHTFFVIFLIYNTSPETPGRGRMHVHDRTWTLTMTRWGSTGIDANAAISISALRGARS